MSGALLGGRAVLRPEPKRLGGPADLPRAMPALVWRSLTQCSIRLELEVVDRIGRSLLAVSGLALRSTEGGDALCQCGEMQGKKQQEENAVDERAAHCDVCF